MHIIIVCNERIERKNKKKLTIFKIRLKIMNFNTNGFPQKNVTNVRLFTEIDDDNNGVPYFLERMRDLLINCIYIKIQNSKHINEQPRM